jgi:hypothetical protein
MMQMYNFINNLEKQPGVTLASLKVLMDQLKTFLARFEGKPEKQAPPQAQAPSQQHQQHQHQPPPPQAHWPTQQQQPAQIHGQPSSAPINYMQTPAVGFPTDQPSLPAASGVRMISPGAATTSTTPSVSSAPTKLHIMDSVPVSQPIIQKQARNVYQRFIEATKAAENSPKVSQQVSQAFTAVMADVTYGSCPHLLFTPESTLNVILEEEDSCGPFWFQETEPPTKRRKVETFPLLLTTTT